MSVTAGVTVGRPTASQTLIPIPQFAESPERHGSLLISHDKRQPVWQYADVRDVCVIGRNRPYDRLGFLIPQLKLLDAPAPNNKVVAVQ